MMLKRLSGRRSINSKPRRLIDVLRPGLAFTSKVAEQADSGLSTLGLPETQPGMKKLPL
jgi:hypothetical protein